MRLSVIIPAYNEERRLGTTLEEMGGYLRHRRFPWELLVVDDGSQDDTVRVADSFRRQFPQIRVLGNGVNFGKGYSVRRGMLAAQGEIRLFSDADHSTPITELEKFWPHFEQGCEVVVGSRALPDSLIREHQPWYREQMGRTFNRLVRLLAVRGIHDTQCGFKAYTATAAKSVFSLCRIPGFGFDVEALFLAQKLDLKIAEVGVEWRNSLATRVSALRDSATMFSDLLRIRATDAKGAYAAPAPGAWTGPLPRKNIPRERGKGASGGKRRFFRRRSS